MAAIRKTSKPVFQRAKILATREMFQKTANRNQGKDYVDENRRSVAQFAFPSWTPNLSVVARTNTNHLQKIFPSAWRTEQAEKIVIKILFSL